MPPTLIFLVLQTLLLFSISLLPLLLIWRCLWTLLTYFYKFFFLKYSRFTVFQVYSKVIQLYMCMYVCVCVCVCVCVYVCVCIFQILFHYRLLQDIEYSSLCYIVVPCWLSFSVSVQFNRSVTSNSLQPHGQKHTRLPCPSPTPGACSNSCSLSQWCHPTISSSVVSFSSCLQSFPASESFPVSQSFASGGQSIGVLASASVLPMNIQDWFSLGWTGLISLQS